MVLTKHQQQILNAEICPYCGCSTKEVTEMDVYGRVYRDRKIIACQNFPNCDAYVGCHADETAMGRLANKRLRGFKNSAHKYFDKIWMENLIERSELYQDLSTFLKLPKELTHIGMFQEHTCKRVIAWSISYYYKIKYQKLINNKN